MSDDKKLGFRAIDLIQIGDVEQDFPRDGIRASYYDTSSGNYIMRVDASRIPAPREGVRIIFGSNMSAEQVSSMLGEVLQLMKESKVNFADIEKSPGVHLGERMKL